MEKLFLLMEFSIYFALLPIVFRVIISIDFAKYFRRNRVSEIKIFYVLVVIIVTKIVGDFFIDIMEYVRQIFNITF